MQNRQCQPLHPIDKAKELYVVVRLFASSFWVLALFLHHICSIANCLDLLVLWQVVVCIKKIIISDS